MIGSKVGVVFIRLTARGIFVSIDIIQAMKITLQDVMLRGKLMDVTAAWACIRMSFAIQSVRENRRKKLIKIAIRVHSGYKFNQLGNKNTRFVWTYSFHLCTAICKQASIMYNNRM